VQNVPKAIHGTAHAVTRAIQAISVRNVVQNAPNSNGKLKMENFPLFTLNDKKVCLSTAWRLKDITSFKENMA